MIVIIDYGMGNVGSIRNMLKHCGHDAVISRETAAIRAAQKLILPGVGSFDAGMRNLHAFGLVDLLTEVVLDRQTPILGICLGMQLLSRGSEEGSSPGLGWVCADTVRFQFADEVRARRIPHMGWSPITCGNGVRLFQALPPDPRFYFVHSYHLKCDDQADVIAWATYGYPFAASVQRGNVFGVQFHPEKSHKFGLTLLKSFAQDV